MKLMLPLSVPATGGAKVTVNGMDMPGVIVTGKVIPLTE